MPMMNHPALHAPRRILLAVALAALFAGGTTDVADRGATKAPDGKQVFDEADTDKNGKLSAAELAAAPGPGPMLAARLADMDRDGDGELSHDEIVAAIDHHGSDEAEHAQREKRHEVFEQADADKNGKLSMAELQGIPGVGA